MMGSNGPQGGPRRQSTRPRTRSSLTAARNAALTRVDLASNASLDEVRTNDADPSLSPGSIATITAREGDAEARRVGASREVFPPSTREGFESRHSATRVSHNQMLDGARALPRARHGRPLVAAAQEEASAAITRMGTSSRQAY